MPTFGAAAVRNKEQQEQEAKQKRNQVIMAQEKIASTIRNYKVKCIESCDSNLKLAKEMFDWVMQKEEGILEVPKFEE